MKFLRNTLDKVKHDFEKGGKWEKYYYVYEALDTFAFVPNTTTNAKGAQIRDAVLRPDHDVDLTVRGAAVARHVARGVYPRRPAEAPA